MKGRHQNQTHISDEREKSNAWQMISVIEHAIDIVESGSGYGAYIGKCRFIYVLI